MLNETHTPAWTKPIPAKKAVEKSPQIPASEMSQEAHIGLMASSRRIAVVQSIDILLRHNPDLITAFELALAAANEKLHGSA